MKKLALSLLLSLFIIPSAFAYTPWDIPEITQDITIHESGKITVEETIKADFSNDSHRGIFREIPVKYIDQFGNRLNLRLNMISVVDENGERHPVAEEGMRGDMYLVKIGDASVWHDTVMTYVLTYEIDRAINYFDNHDELYWNVYEEWEVPVIKTSVKVTIPEKANEDDMQAACYTGYFGSTESQCTAKVLDEHTFEYTNQQTLMPGQGFTIVAGWPKGIITQPSFIQKIWWFLVDNWAGFIPFIAFLLLFLKWWYTGRDPEHKSTIIPRYKAPEGLTPMEVGTIIDEKVDLHDITSIIIDYAVKGYIKIVEIKKKKTFSTETDYEIQLIKPYKDLKTMKPHEKKILNNIFDGDTTKKVSKLKYKFYKHLDDIKKTTYKNLTKEGYFVHNPQNTRETYFGIGVVLGAITFFTFGWTLMLFGPAFPISIMITAGMIFLFGFIMPAKTLKGAKMYTEIKGLEEYIRTAEKDRINFQENANIFFEKLLPYAMVFKMADKWAEAFKDFYKKPPSWFEAADMDHFNSIDLVRSLNRFQSSTNTALASSPRSSGGGSSSWSGGSGFSGGFSGGGFGGGGGGGW